MRRVLLSPDTGSRASRALHGSSLAQTPRLVRATGSSPLPWHMACRRGAALLRNPSQAAWLRHSRTLQRPPLLQPIAQQQLESQARSGPLETQETTPGPEAALSEPRPDGEPATAAALGLESQSGSSAASLAASSGSSEGAAEGRRPAEDAPAADAEKGGEGEPFPLSLLLAAVKAIQGTRLVRFVTNWPAWQQRKRLQQLQEQADANPKDPAHQAKYLRELNRVSPHAVVERFERREHASDAVAVVEYLRGLLASNLIQEYLPDEASGKASALPQLLQELRQRANGEPGDTSARPGLTEQQPLHVVMVEGKPKSVSSKGLRILQEIVGTVLIFILFSVFWVLAATALRRYVAGVTSSAIGGGAPGGAGVGAAAGVYAPKEYSKETMPEKSVKTFADVKGCDEAKAELEEIVEYLKNPTKFTRLGGKLPKGVLLVGPPGTGKTLLAKAIAGEAGVPFFYRAGSEFEEMFVGVGARRVRALFHAAKKKAPCIVFIDEIDAVGASRKQWEGHTKKTLNQLLVEMDGFEANEGIIVIAATNLPEMLDPALTRPGRFDRHVVVANPDIRGRKEILDLYLSDKPRDDSVDSGVLARGTPGFSGADLANLVNMAAVKAALDGNDKISIAQLEFAKDKILMGSERKSMAISNDCRKNTAYHEGGHALVALHTEGALPIHKATIMPRGMALGMVTQLPDDDYENSRTRQQMLARLDVCMGGRVAEEMVFGPDNVTSGARDDLKQATKVARHMVQECGFSDSLGPVFIDPEGSKFSSDTLRKSDAEVVKLLREAYERVRKLLKKHEAELHKLAGALLEKETLTSADIKELLEAPAAIPGSLLPQGGLDKGLVPAAAAFKVPAVLKQTSS